VHAGMANGGRADFFSLPAVKAGLMPERGPQGAWAGPYPSPEQQALALARLLAWSAQERAGRVAAAPRSR
jgi:hypothetical protein